MRIKNNIIVRFGYFAKYKNQEFQLGRARSVFYDKEYEDNEWAIWDNTTKMLIRPEEIESVCDIETWGTVDGFNLRLFTYIDGKFNMMADPKNEVMIKHFGITVNNYEPLSLLVSRTDDEVSDIWEVHKPIKGFPFKGTDWVILKFEGKWLV